ncbi:MAG: PAS domain-containing protein, partial [Candidatus Stygibacter frigidus]|nr:PAS domain-containing protein [Candidatus Stygibacter frigidus]
MNRKNSAASDLFLLMLNLSQMTAKDKIIEVFIEALKEIWTGFRIQFTELAPSSDTNLIEISTAGNTYGWLQVENISAMGNEAESLLNNACGMLAVILRKTEQDILLADEKLHLQKLVDKHILELTDSYEELKREAEIRKQAKEKLQKSELQYRNQANFLNVVIDNSPFAMWVSDAKGILLRANEALRNILNVTDDMIIGKYNVLHDENIDAQGFMPAVEAVFKDLKSARFAIFWEGSKAGDVDLSNANGLWIDVSMFPIQDDAGKLVNVVCQYVDITERKQAEEALQESKYLYQETQKIGKMGGWSYDVESEQATFTDTIYEIYGRKNFTAEEGAQFYHPDDKEIVFNSFNEVITKQKPYDLEVRFINAHGDNLFVRTIGQPLI